MAFDAPLVVNNPTGQRPSEAALNRDFAKFEAGAHPTNTGKPEFAGTPRAARLAAALDLDIDPDSASPRRAIEVYPHPATVALFRLGRTLKYKSKPGRSVAQLRSELLRLMDLDRDARPGHPVVAGHRPRRLDRASAVGGDRRAQERAAPRRGSRRRRGLRLRRAVRHPQTRRRDDLRRRRDGRDHHPDPAAGPDPGTARSRRRARCATPSRSSPPGGRRCSVRPTATSHLVTTLLDDAGINYLERHGADQERGVLRGEGRPQRRRPDASTPIRSRSSPTRSVCG